MSAKRWSIAEGYLHRQATLADGREFTDTIDNTTWEFVDTDDYDRAEELLRRALWSNDRLRAHIQRLLAGLSTSNIDEAMEEGRLICSDIRTLIGEGT